MVLTLGSRTVGVSFVVDLEGKEVIRCRRDVGRDLLVEDRLAIRVDLNVGILESPNTCHRTEVVVAGEYQCLSVFRTEESNHRYTLQFKRARTHKARFSCMKRTECGSHRQREDRVAEEDVLTDMLDLLQSSQRQREGRGKDGEARPVANHGEYRRCG